MKVNFLKRVLWWVLAATAVLNPSETYRLPKIRKAWRRS